MIEDLKSQPVLSGTFLQPWLAERWTDEQWEREFDLMKSAGMHIVILQWSADSQHFTAAYPTSLSDFRRTAAIDVVEKLLTLGEKYDFDIYIGLQLNHDWFVTYASDEEWMINEADIACRLSSDLWDKYGSYDSFAGWYLSFEADNANLLTETDWQRSIDFYQTVGGHIKELTPEKPIMIAPFFNNDIGQKPAEWKAMWEYILSRSPIDIFALQDGVGAGHAEPEHLAAWFGASAEAIRNARPQMQFWSDTETFRLDGNKRFVPADFADVVPCMERVAPFVSRFVSFSYNHYTSPQQVDPKYHAQYMAYLASRSNNG